MANTYPRTPPMTAKYFTIEIPDISTADQRHFAPGFRGKITHITSCINGAIATADADLTAKIEGTAVSGGVITVAFDGSAEGDVDTATPTGNNTFGSTDAIEIETDGASTNAVAVTVVVEVEPV